MLSENIKIHKKYKIKNLVKYFTNDEGEWGKHK